MEDPRLSTRFPARRPDPNPPITLIPSYALLPIIPYYRAPETFWTPDRPYLRAPGNKRYVDAHYRIITNIRDME